MGLGKAPWRWDGHWAESGRVDKAEMVNMSVGVKEHSQLT